MIRDMAFERERMQALDEFVQNGGKEEDFVFDARLRRDGTYWAVADDLAYYRDREPEDIEEELEELQDDLDEIIELIEELEETCPDVADPDSDGFEEYEELLDQRFCVEFHIRQAMRFLAP